MPAGTQRLLRPLVVRTSEFPHSIGICWQVRPQTKTRPFRPGGPLHSLTSVALLAAAMRALGTIRARSGLAGANCSDIDSGVRGASALARRVWR